MPVNTLRNIGIIAHIDAGKTTFSERALYYANVIHRMGEVHEGAALMDFLPEEQERGITIASACISYAWQGHTINLVDTPGHVDFTIEVERSLRVLDGAVGIFCAVGGVEPQSETVWRQADAFHLPRLAVINKMDRPGASFAGVLAALRSRLGVRGVPLTIPVGEGETFCAVLDVVRQERLTFEGEEQGRVVQRIPFTAEDAALAAPYREGLLDALTEHDDALLEQVLAGQLIAPEVLDTAIARETRALRLVPVFAASALRNMGVQPVLDAVCRYLPSPVEGQVCHAYTFARGAGGKTAGAANAAPTNPAFGGVASGQAVPHQPPSGEGLLVPCDTAAPLCALVFKVVMEGQRKVVFLRLYAGTLREGDSLLCLPEGTTARVQRLYRLRADRKDPLEWASAGDIVAVVGIKDAKTGDTLTAPERPLLLEPIRSWKPVISLAFEPQNSEEGTALGEALGLILQEDPTLSLQVDEGTGQYVLSGMGELHLDVVRERVEREFRLRPRVGNPQIVCRETLAQQGAAKADVARELGDSWHFGSVALVAQPQPRGTGVLVTFTCPVEGWAAPLLEGVKAGVQSALVTGLHGYPMDDVAVAITRLERIEGKATVPGLHMAARQATEEAFKAGGAVVLEPLMHLVVQVPANFFGAVMALLATRTARVEAVEEKGDDGQLKEVVAVAPMRALFGFATALRSVTQGRAGATVQFLRFDVAGEEMEKGKA
ncbi:elongation factor G [Desulfovibrio cuneatus]|uniref:elongation factor G n=1 Tax=Desulfovibrio cuneatus TaxID=159728 RepID=UPI0004035CAF|nr:elongation factor G [Desulfovibrio cuneatus]